MCCLPARTPAAASELLADGGTRRYRISKPGSVSPVRSIDPVMPASGKKEGNAARHVRLDLRVQGLELLSVERPYEQGPDDNSAEEARCCRKALRSECKQFAKLVGLGRLAQKPNHGFLRAFAHQPVDPARQIRKPTSLGYCQPDQADGRADQHPLQDVNAQALKALFDAYAGRRIAFEPFDAGMDSTHHDRGEEGLLVGESGVNGRLAGPCQASNLIHTGTCKPSFEK